MINKTTTLILGAGASMAYGFPSGKNLKAMIWKMLDPNSLQSKRYFYKAADVDYNSRGDKETFEAEVKKFQDDLIISPDETIDYFLEHSSKKYQEIGRLAIANVLLEREKKRYLFQDWMEYDGLEKKVHREKFLEGNTQIRPEDGHWYQFLFNLMCKGCSSIDKFADNKISVVTFNYDRSFEYYLLYALMSKFKVGEVKAAEIMKKFDIAHVYGRLGELPASASQNHKAVPYNAFSAEGSTLATHLKNAADGIQLIWDKNDKTTNSDDLGQTEAIQKARDLIYKENNTIIFLGFGFDSVNLSRIMPKKRKIPEGMHAYGTFYKITEQRVAEIKSDYTISYPNGNAELFLGREVFFQRCKIYKLLYTSMYML